MGKERRWFRHCFPADWPLLELSHEVILFYAAVGAKGGAGGGREEMMFAQERDNEAELSMLDVGSGERWIQDGPFKKGRGFRETVVSRVTTRIPKLAPWTSILVTLPSFTAHLLCTVITHLRDVSRSGVGGSTGVPREAQHKVFLHLSLAQRWAQCLENCRCSTSAERTPKSEDERGLSEG